jgi:hypothetical protein
MKKTVLFLLASVLLLAGCNRGLKFTVQGTLDDVRIPYADSVKVVCERIEKPILAAVTNHAFQLQGKVEKPSIAKLQAVGTERRTTRPFILEEGAISFREGRAYGTPLNDSTEAFTKRLNDISKQYAGQQEELKKAIQKEFSAFVSRHPKDPCAIYAIMVGNRRVEPEFLRSLIDMTAPEIKNDGEIHALYGRLKKISQDE